MGVKENRIVVAIDSSPIARTVCKEASDLASALAADVFLISVIPIPSFAMAESDFDSVKIKEEERAYYELHKRLVAEFFSGVDRLVESKILRGDPIRRICEFAEATKARLIILGSRGMGHLQSFFLGSTSEGVMRNAKASVLIVKE